MTIHALPGGGPWRILSQCGSRWHNTVHSASSTPRCVCPRALAISPIRRAKLPGGGPWKILDTCSALSHNTMSASLGRNNGAAAAQCVCPRALSLRDKGLKYMREYTHSNTAPQWLRAGPWKILPECPAEGHNTVNWARRKKENGRCICPRGAKLYADYRAQQNERQKKRDKERTREYPSTAKPMIVKVYPEPDWSQGFCIDDLETVRKGENIEASKEGIADRFEMRSLCGICPVRQECRNWILSNEKPAGSLGGVYGGLDKWNRQGRDMRIVNGRIRVVPLEEGWENEWV